MGVKGFELLPRAPQRILGERVLAFSHGLRSSGLDSATSFCIERVLYSPSSGRLLLDVDVVDVCALHPGSLSVKPLYHLPIYALVAKNAI